MTELDEALAMATVGQEITPTSGRPLRAKISAQNAVAKPGALRTLIVASDESLRRSIVRNTTNTMRNHGHDLFCAVADTAVEALTLLDEKPFDLVLLDEESTDGTLPELVRYITARNPSADLVIFSRDLGALTRTLGERYARHLVPKPVNTHVLASVLGRTSRASRKDTKP